MKSDFSSWITSTQLILRLAHDEMEQQSQRLLHIGPRNGDVRRAKFFIEEGNQFPARGVAGRYAHEPVHHVVDDLGCVVQVRAQNHFSEADLSGVAGNGLYSFDGHLRTAEAT